MKLMKLAMIALFATLAPPSFAAFCPGNYSVINPGDTLDAVKTACGAPTSHAQRKEMPTAPQEWVYYVNIDPTTTSTVRLTIAIANEKVVNISINGLGANTTMYCAKGSVTIGDSAEKTKASCGTPAMINQSSTPQDPKSATVIDELTYTSPSGTVVLTFKDGKFVK